ncbi:MAG: hypothetical protein AAB910_02750 [Patescibacteria group bacterium]
MFDTRSGPVKVKLFEGKVGWNIPNDTPHLFAWGLSGRKFDKLHLTELERIKLDQEYFEWTASVGCGGCKLLGNTCSGLQPKPFNHFAEGQSVVVNSFEADFHQSVVEDKTFNEIKNLIKKGANCKPKEHF